LILLWSFSLVGSLLLSRMSSGISMIIILVAGLVTAILIAIPRHPHPSTIKPIEVTDDLLPYEDKNGDQPRHDEVVKIYDNMFILRVVLSLLLGLTALIGGIYTLLKHFCEQRYAEPVGRSKLVG